MNLKTKKRGKNALALFAKEPQIGRVKTRLAKEIGEKLAFELYQAFLKDTISKMEEFAYAYPETKLFLYHHQPKTNLLSQNLSLKKFNLKPQTEGDLGQRLSQTLEELLAYCHYQRAVIIGVDSPTLPVSFLEEAFSLLEEKDIVLGPSMDGGYYLVGMNRPNSEVFADIQWGTSAVFSETIKKIKSQNLDLGVLLPWYDIDDLKGLRFLKAHFETQSAKSNLVVAKSTEKLLHRKFGHVLFQNLE